MIDKIIEQVIRDLGIQGILLVGLYFALGRFLLNLSTTIKDVNNSLISILECMRNCNFNCVKQSDVKKWQY